MPKGYVINAEKASAARQVAQANSAMTVASAKAASANANAQNLANKLNDRLFIYKQVNNLFISIIILSFSNEVRLLLYLLQVYPARYSL